VQAGKLAIPFGSLPRQLATYHTFSLCTAAVQFVFTEMYYYPNIQIAMSLKMAATCNFLCVCISLAQVLTNFHCPSTKTFCLASF
jgi:hypothetical protein